jgi:hypothetical protein
VAHKIVHFDGTNREFRLEKGRDSNEWTRIDAVLVQAAVKESIRTLPKEDLQRAQDEMAPARRLKELSAA